tara:strand:- start:529 stop:1215 length:687 start_codon:yes stop_codon:yes gene_type:complete
MISNRFIYGAIAIIITIIFPLSILYYLSGAEDYLIKIQKFYPKVDSSMTAGVMNYDTSYYTIPKFSLLNNTGDSLLREDLKGQFMVVDFFFTRCPTICPQMSSSMYEVQEKFEKIDDVKLLSVSIDSEYDRPDVLSRYARKYDANPDKWYFLTGDKNKIHNLASEGFKLSAVQESDGIAITHSDRLVLIDKEGIIRGYYHGTDDDEVDKLIVELRMLIKESRIKNEQL